MIRIVKLFCLLLLFVKAYGQKEKTYEVKKDSLTYQVRLYKNSDTAAYYTHFKFYCNRYQPKSRDLKDEMSFLKQLFDADFVKQLNLVSADVGYPYLYKDVLQNQCRAFVNSAEWKTELKKPNGNFSYKLVAEIMLKTDVYEAFNDLLKAYGYKIKSISIEKLGFVSKADLKEFGYKSSEKVPLPLMVFFYIEKI